jgi:lipopolysaccharide biosynthesis regulator YciM
MGFDFQWFLLALPIAFALGWVASRWDVRQWRTEQRDSPKAYFQGLNFLLNEQQDKAIDAFIEAVQQEAGACDLHFALGNLFRQRGEYERAVRVHQHLLSRADLTPSERERAQYALAKDYLKAGLFDRAQEAYSQLKGTSFDFEARLALLTLHERSRDWEAAKQAALQLEANNAQDAGSFNHRIAHHWCEISLDAMANNDLSTAQAALDQAHSIAPDAARPLIMQGEMQARHGHPAQAMRTWERLSDGHPLTFNLVACAYAESAKACDAVLAARLTLETLYQRTHAFDVVQALALLETDSEARSQRLLAHTVQYPSLSAGLTLIKERRAHNQSLTGPELDALEAAAAPSAQAVHRYRCAACGFEAQRYFWQCPGCQGWDTYPPRRIEDL